MDATRNKASFNTRAKDFDDLLRIKRSGIYIDKKKLRSLLNIENLGTIDNNLIAKITKDAWVKHQKKYNDLPKLLEVVVDEINSWLKIIISD